MPLHIIPRRIFAHRVACKALYRACLTQLPRIPIPDDLPSQGPVPLLKHLIRKGFKKNIYITSQRLVVADLKRGYAAEELLRNAGNGNAAALQQIHDMLRTAAEEKRLARQACARPAASDAVTPHHKTIPAPYIDAPKVLDIRPLPKEKLTGRRVVPTLTAYQWVPFLRFKKPQSRFLGRVLRDKAMQKSKRQEGSRQCDEAMDAGEAESSWEWKIAKLAEKEIALAEVGDRFERMRGSVGEENRERLERLKSWVEGEGRDYGERRERYFASETEAEEGAWRSAWAAEPAIQKYEVWRLINAETEKSRIIGNRMLEIVEKEKELYEQERQERRAAKKAKRRKGPVGEKGGVKREPLAEDRVAWLSSNVWDSQPSQQNEPTTLSKRDLKPDPVTGGIGRSMEWPTREPKSVDTKLETDEDLMERKLQAMQLSLSNAKSAQNKAEPTF